jgi:urease gamma subunit
MVGRFYARILRSIARIESTAERSDVRIYCYSKDKNKLNELLTGDEKFKSMDRNAAEVINTVTGSGLKLKDKEDTIDMCKAIEDMMNDSRSAANIETALRMLEKGKYSIDEIAELVELPIEKVQELSNHKAV